MIKVPWRGTPFPILLEGAQTGLLPSGRAKDNVLGLEVPFAFCLSIMPKATASWHCYLQVQTLSALWDSGPPAHTHKYYNDIPEIFGFRKKKWNAADWEGHED